jgi:hypothetical protein
MRETRLKREFSNKETRIERATDNLRGFGNKLMMKPNFIAVTAKVKFKV